MEIYCEIFSTVILLLPLIQEGLLLVTSERMCTKYWLTAQSELALEKSVVRLTDHLDMTIAVDWDVKQKTKPQNSFSCLQMLEIKQQVIFKIHLIDYMYTVNI